MSIAHCPGQGFTWHLNRHRNTSQDAGSWVLWELWDLFSCEIGFTSILLLIASVLSVIVPCPLVFYCHGVFIVRALSIALKGIQKTVGGICAWKHLWLLCRALLCSGSWGLGPVLRLTSTDPWRSSHRPRELGAEWRWFLVAWTNLLQE